MSSFAEKPGSRLDSATTLFVEWLERDGSQDFEALCAANRGLESELRALRADYAELESAITITRRDRERLPPRSIARLSALLRRHGQETEREAVRAVVARILQRLEPDPPGEARYVDREVVGEGAMGRVYRSWDPRLKRHLARKVLKDDVSVSDDSGSEVHFLARFLAEAQVTSQLHHPAIVPVHDIGLDGEGRLYYTMPLIRGQTLHSVLVSHAAGDVDWPLAKVLAVIVRVCEAVAFAHSRGVVHRDLKPANVMVGEFGETYVMDWGLAHVPEEDDERVEWSAIRTTRSEVAGTEQSPITTQKYHVLGTAPYMSPEQADDPAGATDASDVYSIGAILYELVCGRRPYESPKARAATVLRNLRAGPPKPIAELAPGAPRALAAIVEKAMARAPEDRYGDALALANDIEAFLGHHPTSATPASPFELLRLAIKRNRGVFAVSGIAVGLLLAGAFAFVLALQKEARERQRSLDFVTAQVLLEQGKNVVYPGPESEAWIRSWLDRVDGLVAVRPTYAAAEAAGAPTPPLDDAERATLLEAIDTLRTMRPRMARHLEVSTSLERISLVEHADDWGRARVAIRGSEEYGDLELEPQLGLVPLRRDPNSGLWEFWLVASGTRPEFDDQEPGYRLGDATGVVLVLLPGGEVTVGTPHGTPHRQDNEDLATIRLDPFFIGKYEISQAVWTRVMFDNPSGRSAARKHEDGTFYTWQNPVERVTWHDCLEFCRSLGVVLPTEVQWEHAAKGGSDLLFAYGEDIASLEGRENVRDQAAAEGEPEPPTASWWDGWGMHAPIGSFPANGYGLHDVLGNVSEWCRDRYRRFPEYRDGDGLQVDGSPRELKPDPIPGGVPLEILPDPCVRGGSFYMPIQYTRPAFRNFMAARASHVNFGLRVARAVD